MSRQRHLSVNCTPGKLRLPVPVAPTHVEEEDFTSGALDALLHNKRDRVEQLR